MEVHVSRFAKGFSDIINSSRRRILFFESLELEDFNGLLCGSEKPGELTPIIMVIKKRTPGSGKYSFYRKILLLETCRLSRKAASSSSGQP
ncbi:hypothetical protein ACET3Z_001039 [Daucus carota]